MALALLLFRGGGGTASINVALTGQSQTISTGTLSPNLTIALSGNSVTETLGNLTSSLNKALSGQVTTESQGTLVANIVAFLSGQVETYSQGTLTPDTGLVVQLTGQSESYSQGGLSPSLTVSLLGGSETIAQGSFAVSLSKGITGQSETISQSALAASLVAQITGQSETQNQGTVTPLTGTAVELTGLVETYSLGTLGVIVENGSVSYSGEVTLQRKVYVKRGKQYLIFNSTDEADAYLAAEEAIETAKKSSRGAAKRKIKALKVVKPTVLPEPRIETISELIGRFGLNYDLPALVKNNDIEAIYQLQYELEVLRDEEDIELLLLAAYP